MMWILIFQLSAGAMSKGDSVALVSVPGFRTEQECNEAGRRSLAAFDTPFKAVKFVCVAQSRA